MKLKESKRRGQKGTRRKRGHQKAAEDVKKLPSQDAEELPRGMEGFREENWACGGAELGVRLRAAQAEADCARGGAPKREPRAQPVGRKLLGAPGPHGNGNERPENPQEAAAETSSGSSFNPPSFPLLQPHAVLALSRCASSAHPPPRFSALQA